MAQKIVKLAVSKIRTDGGTQTRVGTDKAVVAEYAERYRKTADDMPPVVVVRDEKANAYWLADGFHRVEAMKEAGIKTAAVDVRVGTQRDALWYSLGANQSHGLRRSPQDKRHAIEKALLALTDEKRTMSARSLADHCGVSDELVAAVRAKMESEGKIPVAAEHIGRDGKKYPSGDRNRARVNTCSHVDASTPQRSNPAPRVVREGAQDGPQDDGEMPWDAEDTSAEASDQDERDARAVEQFEHAAGSAAPGSRPRNLTGPEVEAVERTFNQLLLATSPAPAPTPEPKGNGKAAAPALADSTGRPVPEHLRRAWELLQKADQVSVHLVAGLGAWTRFLNEVMGVCTELANGAEGEALMARCESAGIPIREINRLGEVFASTGVESVHHLAWSVRQLVPAVVCTCDGAGCHKCGSLGYRGRSAEKVRTATDEALRKLGLSAGA